jgi:tetratricopeptide (TPR) repeat protein
MAPSREREEYLEESKRLIDAGLWDEAGDLISQALGRYPDDPEFCLRYAAAITESSPDEAVEYVRLAVKFANRDPAKLTRAGLLFYGHGKIEEAGKCARDVVSRVDESFPLAGDLFYLIGVLALARGSDAGATRYLRLAFDVDPAGHDHAYQFAAFLAGNGDIKQALDVISRALEHGSPDEKGLLELRALIDDG